MGANLDLRKSCDQGFQKCIVVGVSEGKHRKGIDQPFLHTKSNTLGHASVYSEIVRIDNQVVWDQGWYAYLWILKREEGFQVGRFSISNFQPRLWITSA